MGAEFQQRYQKIEFGRDIERGLIKPFTGKIEDYFRFRDTFHKCVHVQQTAIFYKILAFDRLMDEETAKELMQGLGTSDMEYIERINRIEARFGSDDQYRNHLMSTLTDLKKFSAHDLEAVGKFANGLKTYLNMATPLEAENLALLRLLKVQIPNEWKKNYYGFLTRNKANDDLLSLCEFGEEALRELHSAKEGQKFERDLRATCQPQMKADAKKTNGRKNVTEAATKFLHWAAEEDDGGPDCQEFPS